MRNLMSKTIVALAITAVAAWRRQLHRNMETQHRKIEVHSRTISGQIPDDSSGGSQWGREVDQYRSAD